MEKLNLNFHGEGNIFKTICWILSIISWLLFLITGWIAIFGEDYNVWTIPKNVKFEGTLFGYELSFTPYVPIQIEESFIYIIFILTLGIATAGFIVYLIYAICIKTNGVFNGMMGMISRFHFIPFICGSALFIIGEEINDSDNQKDLIIASLIFSIIGFFTLILCHFKTIMDPWFTSLLIKKGTFSCLIALFTYNICYIILQLGILEKTDDLSIYTIIPDILNGKLKDFINNCGTALPLTIGIVNIALSLALKDIVISAMNLIIYIGMTIYVYDVTKFDFKIFGIDPNYKEKNGDEVIDIIMIILSSITIVFLIFFYKTSVFK